MNITEHTRPTEATDDLRDTPVGRELKSEGWEEGYTSGHSRAMRMMSDEPNALPGVNPYRTIINDTKETDHD